MINTIKCLECWNWLKRKGSKVWYKDSLIFYVKIKLWKILHKSVKKVLRRMGFSLSNIVVPIRKGTGRRWWI